MRPVWDSALDRDALRILDPGASELDQRPDVLVIGGGAVGLAAAVMCRRAGLGRVQLIERDRCFSGPSGSPASGLSPGVHAVAHPAFVQLANASLAMHRALDAEWDHEQGLRRLGWLIVSPDRIAPGTVELPGAEVLDGDQAREIEPALGDAAGAIFIRDQAWVHPVRLAVAMARRAGAVATRVAMTDLVARDGRVVSVATNAGEIAPGAVVFATGLVPDSIARVPRAIVKGHLLATEPVPLRLRAAVASSIIVLQTDDGRLVAGGTFDTGDDTNEVRAGVVDEIRHEMGRLLPAAAGATVSHAWCCFRPGTPDQMPVIDRVPGLDNAWLSVGHFRTGILMAPGAGYELARWIAAGDRPSELEAFAIDRFA